MIFRSGGEPLDINIDIEAPEAPEPPEAPAPSDLDGE
jgi:hypothetical protein